MMAAALLHKTYSGDTKQIQNFAIARKSEHAT